MIAAIPSIGRSPFLVDLLNVLLDEAIVTTIQLYDNSREAIDGYSPLMDSLSGDAQIRRAVKYGGIKVEFNWPETIYGSWNRAIRESTRFNEHVAILNDDIVLPPSSLGQALNDFDTGDWGLLGLNYFIPDSQVLRGRGVKKVYGTYRTGGFGGFAFVLPPGSPEVDERFQWWCGDDDLGERVKATGKWLGIAKGAPVAHPAPSTTGNQMPWVQKACGEDMLLFRELYPNAP